MCASTSLLSSASPPPRTKTPTPDQYAPGAHQAFTHCLSLPLPSPYFSSLPVSTSVSLSASGSPPVFISAHLAHRLSSPLQQHQWHCWLRCPCSLTAIPSATDPCASCQSFHDLSCCVMYYVICQQYSADAVSVADRRVKATPPEASQRSGAGSRDRYCPSSGEKSYIIIAQICRKFT